MKISLFARLLPATDSKSVVILGIAGALIAQLFIGLFLSLPASALTTVTVNSLTILGWSTADTRVNGHTTLIADATAPLGRGALSLKTDGTTPSPAQDKAQFMTTADVTLADVVNHPIYYSTKQNSASFVAGLPSFQLPINLNGTSGFTTLVYEPYNNEGNDAVHNGEWQQWNVGEGKFWSTRAVGSLQPSQGTYQYTLAQILAEFPNAKVLGFGVNVGSNNPNYDTEVDGLAFNDNLYDFEPEPVVPAVVTGLGFTQAGLACGGATNSNPVTLSWGAAANATSYTYHVDRPSGAPVEATVAGTTVPFTFTTEGVYSYKVRANNTTEGTQSAWSDACTVRYDKTAPTVAFGVTGMPFSASAGSTVTFSGTSTGATSVRVFMGTNDLGEATLSPNGNWTLTTVVPTVPAGTYAVKAVAKDAAGNTATTSPWYAMMIFSFPFWW